MKKSLQFLLALFLTTTLTFKGIACDAPTNLTSLVEENVPGYGYTFRVTMSWDAVDNADFYSLYFFNDNYPDGIWLGDTDGLYYISGANTEASYQFAVVTHCADGSSSEMSEKCTVTIQSGATPCMTPSNLQATVEKDLPNAEFEYTITLTWDAVEGAEKYKMYVNGDAFDYTTENTYVTGTNTAQILQFAVATVCDNGDTSPTSPAITVNVDPCMPPTNLQAVVEEDVPGYSYKYKVTLTWDAFDNAQSYTIYENGIWKAYSTTTSYEAGYNTPATIFFNVTSYCENGESNMTDPVTVVLGATDEPCLAPTNLDAIVEQDVEDFDYKFKVTMTWDAVENAQGYFVYVNGQEQGFSTSNFYIAGSDVEGTFNFTVITVCANGESEESESHTVNVQEVSLEEYANKFEIYPNPANEVLFINTTEKVNEVSIFNIVGVCIYNETSFTTNNIDLSNINSGVYFVRINTEKGDVVKRFIKQ